MKIKELIKKLQENQDLDRDVWVYGTNGIITNNIHISWDDLGDAILYEGDKDE